MGIVMSKRFLRSMAQPFEHNLQNGISLWSVEHIEARQAAVREAAEGGRLLPGADETRAPEADAEANEWYEGFDGISDADIMAIEGADTRAPVTEKVEHALSAGAGASDGMALDED